MADATPTYDLTLLLAAELPDDERAKVVSEVERVIQGSGTLVGRHDWGMRRLAYEINHRVDAEYHLLQFQGSAELIESLQRSLRISDAVVRFRIIKLPPGAPAPPEVRPDPRVVEAPRSTDAPEPAGEIVADETPAADEAPAAQAPAPAEPAATEEAAAPEAPAAREAAETATAQPAEAQPEQEAGADDAGAEQPAEGAPSSA